MFMIAAKLALIVSIQYSKVLPITKGFEGSGNTIITHNRFVFNKIVLVGASVLPFKILE